jgi:hypothetical protein
MRISAILQFHATGSELCRLRVVAASLKFPPNLAVPEKRRPFLGPITRTGVTAFAPCYTPRRLK